MTYNLYCIDLVQEVWGESEIIESLKKDSEFRRVYDKGKTTASSYLVLFWLENGSDKNRYGFTVSKKVGTAVTRNKIKRRLKEIVRRWLSHLLKPGFDMVIIARPWVKSLNFYEIKQDLKKLFQEADLFTDRS